MHRELLGSGFSGSKGPVIRFLGFLRAGEGLAVTRSETVSKRGKRIAPQSVWAVTRLLAMPRARLDDAQRRVLEALLEGDMEIGGVYRLIQGVRSLISSPAAENGVALRRWIERAAACNVVEFGRLARSLDRDFRAVAAGLTTAWSNAQTEGRVTRLKLIKRQRYGRAGFELFRQCVLMA
jgi:transposase